MTDRLAEIKAAWEANDDAFPKVAWLIAEVERLKDAVQNLGIDKDVLNADIERLKAEQNDCLHNKSYRLGLERAEVLVGVVPEVESEHIRTTIAAAIRAEIKA